ncbi:dipeptidase [Candidatus Neomarinimicrobiota bacterium]
MKKRFLSLIFFSVFLISCIPIHENTVNNKIITKANKIHNDVLTLDTHVDTPFRLLNQEFDIYMKNNPVKTHSKIDFPRMKEGGLDAAFFAVFVGQGERAIEANIRAKEKALSIFNIIYEKIAENPEIAEIALTPADAYRLEKEGKKAIYIGMENGYPIGTTVDNIKEFYDLGARYITLCHTSNNEICDSATDTLEHNGLSDFGEQVVTKMNDLGMIIDISHVSDKSFYDIIELSKAPVIASHSCSRTVCDNPRNLTDDMLKKLSENGGVIQMCILSNYVKIIEQDSSRIKARKALREKYNNWNDLSYEMQQKAYGEWNAIDETHPPILATVSDAVDHIDHIVDVAGINHVGIGTDFDGGGGLKDCFDVSQIRNITIELVKRGYANKDIEKIWGGNFMRVFNEVQQLVEK